MKKISSKDNSIIKETASLKEKKFRDKLGLFLVEGPNLVRELRQECGKAHFIFIRAGANKESVSIAESFDKTTAVYELEPALFDKLCTSENPQDIIAVAEKPKYSVEDFFKKVREKNILVIDRLQDPGNIGTIIRSAEAFGYGGIIFLKGSADPFQPKVVRAAAGSLLRFPLLFIDDPKELLSILKTFNKQCFATAMNAEYSLLETDISNNTAIIVGNEGNGVCEELLSSCKKISIPMEGKTESLNAAIAAAIIMYESKRQRS